MKNINFNFLLVVLIIFLTGLPAMAASVSTNFEFSDRSGSFTLGDAPNTVAFSNGEAKTIGRFSLYRSGANSWMVDIAQTGVIEFANPAQSVNFFFRDQNSSANSVLSVLDVDGNELRRFIGSDSWTEVNLTDTAIARITLQNNASNGYSVIDDFSAEILPATVGNLVSTSVVAGSIRVRLKEVVRGLTAPNWGSASPGDDSHLYVSDQNGVLWKINLITGEKSQFLDVSDRLVSLGISGAGSFDERGLLGFAFAPDFQSNGLVYTYSSEPADGNSDFSTMPSGSQADHKSVILEWQANLDNNIATSIQADSKRTVLEIEQPQFNHDGGGLNFGPDGLLYISLGDGGGADDVDGQPFFGGPMIGHGSGNAQDKSNPLGALLRIDPNTRDAANGRYGIPASNPFVAQNDALDEIFAYGLRNPFRFSFDREDGQLYLADVGQNDIEEINIIVAGGNYGWNKQEGSFLFNPNGEEDGSINRDEVAAQDDTINPIAEYDHNEGTAIIGGFVYRGKTIDSINGKYIFGDFSHPELSIGRLFYNNNEQVEEFQLTLQDQLDISVMGFGQDSHGEIYLLGNRTGTPFGDSGVVFKIVANSSFDGSLVKIPVVDVRQSGNLINVFQAELRLVPGSDPALFELTQEISALPLEYAGDNAIFDIDNNRLSLPFVDVKDSRGNITSFFAELRQTDTTQGLFFELVSLGLVWLIK